MLLQSCFQPFFYDKQNIIFDDDDKTTIVETDKFTIKLPDSLKKSDDSESYKNENNSLNFLIKDEFIDFEEIFDDTASNEKMKQTIIDEYGFFPKSQYEYYHFMERISDYKPNLLKRDLNNAISTIKLADSILAKDTDIYLYNDSIIEFCIEKTMIERPDGITAYFYNISGNVVDNYDKFFEISIFTTSEYSDQNIVYKIINSIEFK